MTHHNPSQGPPSGSLSPSPFDHDAILLLGRIDGKLTIALKRLEDHEEASHRIIARINELERHRAKATGYVLGIGALAGFLSSGLFKGIVEVINAFAG